MSCLRIARRIVLPVFVSLVSGCAGMRVQEEQQPVSETTLLVTRSGEAATLAWQTRPGFEYVLLYSDAREPRSAWRAVPGAERVVGTGAMVTRTDRAPSGTTRYYRLKLLKAGPREP